MSDSKREKVTNQKKDKINVKRWIICSFLGVSALFIILTVFVLCFWDTLEHSGLFGDTFGSINAFFSALAFAGVIIAIFMQRKELELQREELEQTRTEFKKQTEEFEKQNKTLSIQRFENTFFNMLNLLNNAQNQTVIVIMDHNPQTGKTHRETIKGWDAFIYFEKKLEQIFADKSIDNLESKLNSFFHGETHHAESQLGHYFKTIYSILKTVEKSRFLDIEDKKYYANILRAQLSNNELFLLFYNCIWRSDFILFRLLVEKYSLLKHLNQSEVSSNEIQLYQARAFDKKDSFIVNKYDKILIKQKIENYILNE